MNWKRALANLPEIIVHGASRAPFGLMIARGDLAVEIGWSRLAEIQEEMLWLAEAAHVPVVWATQVFEQLIKENPPSRAEMTDAAMSDRAVCVPINTRNPPACGHYIGKETNVMANAVKNIARFIRKNPDGKAASDLRDLCMALESSASFDLGCLYQLDKKPFELAIDLLEEWRFDRHVFERRLQKYLDEPAEE